MTAGPLVSIYVPTKGRPALLERAVRSALAQTHREIEVIVVVDGVDPATERVLEGLTSDSRVLVKQRATSGGACVARNEAIFTAQGSLITGLDDDDELLPDHVARLVDVLRETGASFSCTTAVLRRASVDQVRHAFRGPVELGRLLEQNIVGNQVLTRVESLRALGGFDVRMPAWQDYDMWVRLCARYGSGFKVDARSYVQRLDHEGERISRPDRIEAAYRLFLDKHEALLSPRHRASLELLMYATTHRPFPPSRLIPYVRAGYGRRALAALLSDRMPALRPLARWVTAAARR